LILRVAPRRAVVSRVFAAFPHFMPRPHLPFGLLLCSLCVSGCVTESSAPVRGTPVKASPGAAVPAGPLATPASNARTTISRINVAVVPLGLVEYDGLTLPLVSPDGRFMVTRTGAPPEWPALLAAPGASPPSPGSFRAFAIRAAALEPLELAAGVPADSVLGRDADSQGFLIEQLKPDGTRVIGKVGWLGNTVTWLVESPEVNAHAVFHADGLVFVRRGVDAAERVLVYRDKSGREDVRSAPGGGYAMPLHSPDASIVWVLRSTAAGTEIESIRFADGAFGATLTRTLLTASNTPAAAFQLAMSTANTIPSGSQNPLPFAILSTRLNGVVAVGFETARATVLSKGAVAVTPIVTGNAGGGLRGYICTRDDGLVYVPEGAATPTAGNAVRPDARLLDSPYVVRATSNESAPFILLGPSLNAPDRMEVLKMAIAPGGR